MPFQYRKGYEYQLANPYVIATTIRPRHHIETEFIRLTLDGLLTLHSGYAWDGASGGALDTPTIMRGSGVHDAFYQLFRQGNLDRATHRKAADALFKKICRDAGMSRLRAWWVFNAVRRFAADAASAGAKKEVITAP